jgi:hypothetical protein
MATAEKRPRADPPNIASCQVPSDVNAIGTWP